MFAPEPAPRKTPDSKDRQSSIPKSVERRFAFGPKSSTLSCEFGRGSAGGTQLGNIPPMVTGIYKENSFAHGFAL
jgi:hypothetical protein